MTRTLFLLALTGLTLSACNDTRDLAPQSADRPWHPATRTGLSLPPDIRSPLPPIISTNGSAIAGPDTVAVHRPEQDGRPVTLVQLIDLSERNNPQTHIAWETARQAAIGIGVSRATLLPQLTLSAMGGFQRMALPLPNYLSSRGYLTSNGAAAFPKLELDYLLFDFGQSKARVDEARFETFAADYGFTAVHQALILQVISAYHAHQAAKVILNAAHTACENMALLLRAAQARRDHGEATLVDIATAQRNLAQARFDTDKAEDSEHTALHALLEVAGLPATMKLAIASMDGQTLPQTAAGQIPHLVERALSSRPDLLADIARLRAQNAALNASKAALRPKISISATASGYLGQLKTYGTGQSAPASAIAQPEAGAFLQFSWPIYQGGLRANAIRMAESRRDQAEATLLKDRLAIERQVADTQDALETALAQVRSARVLNEAAKTANQGAAQAYAHGVGTLTDASTAATMLYQAQASLAVSYAEAFTKAAELAHATGQLELGKTRSDDQMEAEQ